MNAMPPEPGLKHDLEKISTVLAGLLEDVEGALHGPRDDEGREKLQRVCAHLRHARSEIQEGARKIEGAVHDHPWRSLAAGALVGFLAGLLVRRR